MLIYIFYLDELFQILMEKNAEIKFVEYFDNSFMFVLSFDYKYKSYMLNNLLNLKNIYDNIIELSIGIQPDEKFIKSL